ncbi:MarR family winged helix-turn-helix transcriptional regulator [Microbacterium sp. P04]|uniref:MarR family winged helix-turn-helix transcriptional regulator n=1 Tax=Microbacterium sp. P04 TaxID=3366947 RepID=UPI00374607D8
MAEQVRYLVLAAQREGNRRLATALGEIGLTPAQSEVLRILGDHSGLTLHGVGAMLVCDSGTNPSRLIEKLVRAGLVERTSDPSDRRSMRLSLTASGAAAERRVRTIEDAVYAQIDAVPDAAALARMLQPLVSGTVAGEALRMRIEG